MNEKLKELRKKALEKAKAAQKAAEEGKLEEYATLYAEAEELDNQFKSAVKVEEDKIEALKKAKALAGGLEAIPDFPASLPGDDPPSLESPPQQPKKKSAEDKELEYAHMFYVQRYGEIDKAAKAVLSDLYGQDYARKQVTQWKAFNHYLRAKERYLKLDERALLEEIILTPKYATKAVLEGWSVSHLKATMVEAIGDLGGYVVPIDYQERIIERMAGFTVMRGGADIRTTNRDRVQVPRDTGGDDQYTSAVREYFVNETPASTAALTNLTFALEDINVEDAMSVIPISKSALEDSAFDLPGHMSRKVAEAGGINEDNKFLTGHGGGTPYGVLPGSTNPSTRISEVNSGAAAALTFDGLVKMPFGIASQYLDGAVWIANRTTYQTIATMTDGTGNYLWTEMRGNNATGQPTMLRGFPALQQEAMPDIAANTYPILFGQRMGYLIVDRLGMTVTRYDVNPGENIIKYEFRRRYGGQLVEPYRFCVQKVAA